MSGKEALRQRFRLPRVGDPVAFPALRRLRHELPPGDVLMFAPSAGEPDVWPLAEALAAEGRLLLPRIEGATLTVHRVSDLRADVAPGTFGLREPTTPVSDAGGLTAVVLPGLVFDARGGRLGRGKGYYDRLLERVPTARRIAVCFDDRVIDEVPMEPHDQRMDVVVTPTRTLRVPKSTGALADVRAGAASPDALTVFDLDSTLFSTGLRHLGILREFAATWPDPAVAAVAQAASPGDFDWEVHEPLTRAGLVDPVLHAALYRHWQRAFFSDTWADADEPVAGAVDFVQQIAAAPGRVVYLTGRAQAPMGAGTRRLLARWGMPLDDGRLQLWLKPSETLADASWKQMAHRRLKALGRVVGTFENEPGHANAFRQAFPDATHVLVGNAHSPNAPAPDPDLRWIPDFDAP